MNAILLAAGYGTRLLPITKKTPKCLVKINNDNLLNIWKQLPFINLKKTISYKQKQLHHAAKKVLSREQKEKILRKKYS